MSREESEERNEPILEDSTVPTQIFLERKILQTILAALEVNYDDCDLNSLTEETASSLQSRMLDAIACIKRRAAAGATKSSQQAKAEEEEDEASGWVDYVEETHVPSFSIDSPVVANVLSTWSDEESKRDYFLAWAKSLKKPWGSGYPQGIQITRVSKVLRDAFLMLVYPVLKQMCTDKLVATVREHQISKQVPLKEVVLADGTNLEMDLRQSSDPFITQSSTLYDLRFRRVGTHARGHEEPHHSTEGDNYSPLSEINSVFKELEHKAKEEMLAHELQRQQRNSFTAPPGRSMSQSDAWSHSLTAWLTGNPLPNAPNNRRSSFSDFVGLGRQNHDPHAVVDNYGSKRSFSSSGVPLEAGAYLAGSGWWGSDGNTPTSDAQPRGGGGEYYQPPHTGGRSISMDSAARGKGNKISERLAALRANK